MVRYSRDKQICIFVYEIELTRTSLFTTRVALIPIMIEIARRKNHHTSRQRMHPEAKIEEKGSFGSVHVVLIDVR